MRGAEEAASTRSVSRRLPSTNTYSIYPGRLHEASTEETETTLERLRRLRSEVEELEEDVRREKAQKDAQESAGGGNAEGRGRKKEVSPSVILQQLHLLRGDLGGLEGKLEGGVLEGEGEKEDDKTTALAQKAKVSSSLLSKLGLGSTTAPVDVKPSGRSVGGPQAKESDRQLEKRLAEIERVVGASDADVDESHPLPPPLLQTLTRLDHLLTLLTQPRHLDSISRRVKVLVSDLERLHESRRKLGDTRPLNVALSGGMTVAVAGTIESKSSLSASVAPSSLKAGSGEPIPPDTLQKLDALFSLLPRLDPLLPLTPRLLTRLRSLATLHSSAATFGETLSGLKDEVERLAEGEKGLKEVLDGLEKSRGENEGKVRGNLEGLDGRVGSLVERLAKLGL